MAPRRRRADPSARAADHIQHFPLERLLDRIIEVGCQGARDDSEGLGADRLLVGCAEPLRRRFTCNTPGKLLSDAALPPHGELEEVRELRPHPAPKGVHDGFLARQRGGGLGVAGEPQARRPARRQPGRPEPEGPDAAGREDAAEVRPKESLGAAQDAAPAAPGLRTIATAGKDALIFRQERHTVVGAPADEGGEVAFTGPLERITAPSASSRAADRVALRVLDLPRLGVEEVAALWRGKIASPDLQVRDLEVLPEVRPGGKVKRRSRLGEGVLAPIREAKRPGVNRAETSINARRVEFPERPAQVGREVPEAEPTKIEQSAHVQLLR